MTKTITGTILDIEYQFEIEYDHTEADNGISESIDITSITPVDDRTQQRFLARELLDLLKEEAKENKTEQQINRADDIKNLFGGMNAGIVG